MSDDKFYKDGDIVWVKLGNNWWPGEVTGVHRQPEGLLKHLKRKPYCVVKFFQEDSYEYVKSSKQIFPFNCNKKDEFTKKGLALYNSKNKFMEKFPSDVEIAERLTRRVVDSDMLIINDRPDSIVKAILGQALTTRTSSDYYSNDIRSTNTRRSGDSITKILNITPNRTNNDTTTSNQSITSGGHKSNNFSTPTTPTTPAAAAANNSTFGGNNSSAYRCNLCDFTSLRQNVMIFHRKSHTLSSNNSSSNNNSTTRNLTVASKITTTPTSTTATTTTPTTITPKITSNIPTSTPAQRNKPGVASKNLDLSSAKTTPLSSKTSVANESLEIAITPIRKTAAATAITKPTRVSSVTPEPPPKQKAKRSTLNRTETSSTPSPKPTKKKEKKALPKRKSLVANLIEKSSPSSITPSTSFESISTTATQSPELKQPDEVLLEDEERITKSTSSTRQSTNKLESPPPVRKSEDIIRSFQAEWSDEEENLTVETVSASAPVVLEKTTVASAELSEMANPASESENTTTAPVVAVSTVLPSSGRIRNIPKKDRRDIILKEFPPNELNSNSQSSASMTPPVVSIESSNNSDNSSEAVVVVPPTAVEATPVEEEVEEEVVATAIEIVTEPETPIEDTSTVVAIDEEPPESAVASAVPTYSCFDFQEEEENDTDVLSSIAKFKKKHLLSPEKNQLVSDNDADAAATAIAEETKIDEEEKVTSQEQEEIENQDQQLSAEIESLLQQTQAAVDDISAVASIPPRREDVPVKALPIKERGKRIFKSRNRSRVEDSLNTSVSPEKAVSPLPQDEAFKNHVDENHGESNVDGQIENNEASTMVYGEYVQMEETETKIDDSCNYSDQEKDRELHSITDNHNNIEVPSEAVPTRDSSDIDKLQDDGVILDAVVMEVDENKEPTENVLINSQELGTENENPLELHVETDEDIQGDEDAAKSKEVDLKMDEEEVISVILHKPTEIYKEDSEEGEINQSETNNLNELPVEDGHKPDGIAIVEELIAEASALEDTNVNNLAVEELQSTQDPSVEEPIVQEPSVEEEPTVEEPNAEEPIVEEPMVEEPAVEETVVEEPIVEESAVDEPSVEESAVEESAVEEPTVEEPTVEEPTVQEPTERGRSEEEPIGDEFSVVERPTSPIEDSEIKEISTESSLQQNDIDPEIGSRFESPIDENSSIGISDAGAEFGSPTSMLDDERLPIVASSLIADTEQIPDNTSLEVIETDEVKMAEANDSLTKSAIIEEEEVVDENAIQLEKDVIETQAEENAVNKDEGKLEDDAMDNVSISNIHLMEENLNDNHTAVVEEEEVEMEEEDDLESPPHEKLSGNELEKEEEEEQEQEKVRTKRRSKKTKQEKLIETRDNENHTPIGEEILTVEAEETPPKEIQIVSEDVKIEESIIEEVKELDAVITTTPNDQETFELVENSSRDAVVPSYREVEIKSDGPKSPEIDNNDISILYENVILESQSEKADNSPDVTEESTCSTPDVTAELEATTPKAIQKQTVTRKRRSHIKITPRKRGLAMTPSTGVAESFHRTEPKTRRKSESNPNEILSHTTSTTSSSTSTEIKILENQTELRTTMDNITPTTTTTTIAASSLSEMRLFRPRRKTNQFDGSGSPDDTRHDNNSQDNIQIQTSIVFEHTQQPQELQLQQETTEDDVEMMMVEEETTVRPPSPSIEKVRINVDVANPLSSQIASILATSAQQQQRTPFSQAESPTNNKLLTVSNLPSTTTISKSKVSHMKRKKSIEDDIPSFIIERPHLTAEREAFAHVQNKCPQVKITRKEKIIEQPSAATTTTTTSQPPQSPVLATLPKGTSVMETTTSSSKTRSPTQMIIINQPQPQQSKQQKLVATPTSDIVGVESNSNSAAMFDIGNMPILLTNDQLMSDNVHFVITPTVETVTTDAITATQIEQALPSQSKQQQQTILMHVVPSAPSTMTILPPTKSPSDGPKIIQQQIIQAAIHPTEVKQQPELTAAAQQQPVKSRKTPTNMRTKRLPSRQNILQQQQQQQAEEEQKKKQQQQELEQQKLTPYQKQLQDQQRFLQIQKQQQSVAEQKLQTTTNKQIGVDSRGNKYVIIKTQATDLVLQQQQQPPMQQMQQHSVGGQQKAQSGSFSIGSGVTVCPIVETSTTTARLEETSSLVVAAQETTQQQIVHTGPPHKVKSPAAAATGGRKQAGNTITLPSSITVQQHQQQFTDSMQAASISSSPSSSGPAGHQKTKSSTPNHKGQARGNLGLNRRTKAQQQQEAMNKKLLSNKDKKNDVAGNRRSGSAAESPLPTKVPKTSAKNSFTGDVVIAQQQQQQHQQQLSTTPPPLHHLHNKKPRKQPQQSRTSLSKTRPTAATVESNELLQVVPQQQPQVQPSSSNQTQQQQQLHQQQQLQQSVHSTTISEEQLVQMQSDDQIEGTSKILAVPTQPIPGYNETFLLCTLVNNNYKPIDNIPLYLDHDLNQLVPVPLEAINGQPNLIVNHPPPDDIVNQMNISTSHQQPQQQQQQQMHSTLQSHAEHANGGEKSLTTMKAVEADSSTQMLCLQATMDGDEQQVSSEIVPIDPNHTTVVANEGDEAQMAVYIPPECAAQMPSDNAVIINIEGQQIILDAATFEHLLKNPDANTQLITDDGAEFVLTREVLAALEAQQDTQEEAAVVEQQQRLQQQLQQTHQITEAGPTDILAVALAGSDLYGSEVLEIETSQGLQLVGTDGIVFQSTGLPQAHLTPPITAQTSETNALLNQTPIMSTLEKPSTSAASVSAADLPACRQNLEDSLAVIGVTTQSSSVPTSLELPITVTNPAIAPKATMAGPTAPVGLSSTSSVVVTESVQFQCLPHRTGLAGESRIYNDPGS